MELLRRDFTVSSCILGVALLCAGAPVSARAARGAHPAPEAIHFARACENGKTLTIAAVGDVLLHTPLQKQAAELANHGRFTTLWAETLGLLSQADLTYANLEGPAAYGLPMGSYPRFNYDPALIDDLRSSGVDLVSTANNHALDRESVGADRTIEKLEQSGMLYSGTRRRGDTQSPWYAVTRQGGFSLAWIACSFSTNGIADKFHQVLHCYEQAAEIEAFIRELSAREDLDGVIVTPHWGNEYEHHPSTSQVGLGRRFFKAGALAILGSHPHVLQPLEKVTVDGTERLIAYSLANFVSGQEGTPKKTSALLYLGLSRSSGAKAWINGVRHVPLFMDIEGGRRSVAPFDRLKNVPPEARALVTSLLPAPNELGSQERPVTNPECTLPGVRPLR